MTTSDFSAERRLMLGFAAVAGRRAPLYRAFAVGAAEHRQVLSILAEAPASSRLPVTVFAAVHSLLLADPTEPLAAWYPNLTAQPRTDDAVPALVELCERRRTELVALVRTRAPQTNEIGRSAVLMLGLAQVAAEQGPLAHLDVGASAGLNLLSDRYRYHWGAHSLGSGNIDLVCDLTGTLPTGVPPTRLPRIEQRLGLDRAPVDITDPEQVRWLEACVWPDQADRFARLEAALAQAQALRPQVLTGDAVQDLPAAVARLRSGHPVITTSWVLNYLDGAQQEQFWARLNEVGQTQNLSWVAFESPEVTAGLHWPQAVAGQSLSVLRLVRWRSGRLEDEVLASGHPHGYWLRWGSALAAVASQHL